MDAPGLDPAIYARCLDDLASVNRTTFAHKATLNWLRRSMAHLPPGSVVSVLDIAYGQGDLLRAIARMADEAGLEAELTGIDLNPRSAAVARAVPSPETTVTYLTGDVFLYAPSSRFDFIVTSQFTHHLTDEAVVQLMAWMEAHASKGWYIADLHRHWFPYYGFRWLARLAGWHEIVRRDGTVSIARGFKSAEWQSLLARAGVSAEVRWHMLFRHGISRDKG
jgi:2-polyprenyl-3-methyl-5-hydroxy-6-metoxy-1,4-benzoquinol methylase